ncbi:serine/threonine-protein kinase Chk2-like [Crassostrea virginica]
MHAHILGERCGPWASCSLWQYLHDEGITHRDLKPENILLSTEDNETLIKVTDFGLSKFVDAGTMMKTFCGTPSYLAPEILLTVGMGSYTKAIDCWSLGVILYICLVGCPPFSDERKDMALNKQIIGGHYSFPSEYWKDISEDAIDVVKKLLTVDPKKRATLEEVISHPWFKVTVFCIFFSLMKDLCCHRYTFSLLKVLNYL